MKRSFNLFIELHKEVQKKKRGLDEDPVGTGWENLFTDQLAFFLSADLAAATSLARLYLGDVAGEKDVQVTKVSTQAGSEFMEGGTPDLKFDLHDKTCIYVEHKIEVPLDHGQLQKYLGDEQGKVALVSHRGQKVPDDVPRKNYLRPKDRLYFDWHDVYRTLDKKETPEAFGALRRHFLDYMRNIGLAPSNLPEKWKLLFEHRGEEENQKVQRDFGKLLDSVVPDLRDRGLVSGGVSHSGKSATPSPDDDRWGRPDDRWWAHLYIRPRRIRTDLEDVSMTSGDECLVIDLICDSKQHSKKAKAVHDKLHEGFFKDSNDYQWHAVKHETGGKYGLCVSLATPLKSFFERHIDDSALRAALKTSTVEALDRMLDAVKAVA